MNESEMFSHRLTWELVLSQCEVRRRGLPPLPLCAMCVCVCVSMCVCVWVEREIVIGLEKVNSMNVSRYPVLTPSSPHPLSLPFSLLFSLFTHSLPLIVSQWGAQMMLGVRLIGDASAVSPLRSHRNESYPISLRDGERMGERASECVCVREFS